MRAQTLRASCYQFWLQNSNLTECPSRDATSKIEQKLAYTAEIARDAKTAIQGHSRSSAVVPIDAA